MDDRGEAVEALLRAKEGLEKAVEDVRRALECLQDKAAEGPSTKDLGVVEQLRDIVTGGRKGG